MESYRLYLYDPEGRIDRTVEIDSRSDADAIDILGEHAVRHPLMELWTSRRLVASYGTNPRDVPLSGPGLQTAGE
jgi:hypothetical protein